MGTTADKLARVLETKTELKEVLLAHEAIDENTVFSEYPSKFEELINDQGDLRTISVNSSGSDDDSLVSGGGMASDGMTVTVHAGMSNSIYTFTGWYEDGVRLSGAMDYTFLVDGDRELTAKYDPKSITDLNWKTGNLSFTTSWSVGASYANGIFFVTTPGHVARSTDGINWISITLPTSGFYRIVAYGNGLFVTVAQDTDKAAYSTDGINWVESNMPYSSDWYNVVYGDGKFVALSYKSSKAAYSTNGMNWVEITLPVTIELPSVAYGGGRFVAISYDTNKFVYSDDGVVWYASTLPLSRTKWTSIVYGNDRFVAVTNGYTDVIYSKDGFHWANSTLPAANYWACITYGYDRFVTIATNNINAMAISPNGLTWTSITPPVATTYRFFIVYGNGRFVIACQNEAIVDVLTYEETT